MNSWPLDPQSSLIDTDGQLTYLVVDLSADTDGVAETIEITLDINVDVDNSGVDNSGQLICVELVMLPRQDVTVVSLTQETGAPAHVF